MIKKLTLTLVAFLAVVIGFLTIAPSEMSFDDAGYNSKNVLEHLQVIADKPHSVTDYEAHEEVRQYILNVSKGFVGEKNVRERNYLTPSNKNPTDGIEYVGADLVEANEIDCEYDIRNVLACLNGKSETGVLLVAHYDSRGNIKRYGELAKSYGAGDAVGAYALFFGKKRRVGKFRLLSFYRLGGAEYVRLSSRIQKYGAYEQGQSCHQRRGTRHERRGLYV